ncbi:unnamed protein product [Adineta ricciae]|uniref:Barrier to autointegration factor n=1 Tax=Adineta ricciae TaxID=249248 RepID=A0A814B8B8_ADIRI|nr:unnamed protein product [Adineta ricciae]
MSFSSCFCQSKPQRLFVNKSILFHSIASNQNCCGSKEQKAARQPVKIKRHTTAKDNIILRPSELIIDIPKQTNIPKEKSSERLPLSFELVNNAWPISNQRIENQLISNKRCQFSNEAISIKPITAVPGIGQKYGQLLADHGFIYARQLLGYYLILKDSEMFRKWLEYRFHIPRFRAAEITDSLNALLRQIF